MIATAIKVCRYLGKVSCRSVTGTSIYDDDDPTGTDFYDTWDDRVTVFCYTKIPFQQEFLPVYKDPFFLVKLFQYKRYQNYRHSLLLSMLFNIYTAKRSRKTLISKSGFLARVGRKRKGRL